MDDADRRLIWAANAWGRYSYLMDRSLYVTKDNNQHRLAIANWLDHCEKLLEVKHAGHQDNSGS